MAFVLLFVGVAFGYNKLKNSNDTKNVQTTESSPLPSTSNAATSYTTPEVSATPEPLVNGKPAKNAQGMPQIPDFTMKDKNGKSVSLSDYKGKVVILNFWASWCPYCKQELPDFKAMNDEFLKDKNQDVVLLELDEIDGQRETHEAGTKYMKDNGFESMTNLFDEQDKLFNMFGFQGLPSTVVIDRNGYVSYFTSGAIAKDKLLPEIEKAKAVK